MTRASEATNLHDRALALLTQDGLLLMSDRVLPSLVTLVVGAPVRGSWWGHPQGRAIYALANALEDHSDVLLIKLIAGKDTFVHRSLWPALLVIARARDRWQMENLSQAGSILLQLVDQHGELRADDMPVIHASPSVRTAVAARELERRLLARSGQVHTESGAHSRLIESWRRWATRVGATNLDISPSAAIEEFEAAARSYAARARDRAAVKLPWPRKPAPTR